MMVTSADCSLAGRELDRVPAADRMISASASGVSAGDGMGER